MKINKLTGIGLILTLVIGGVYFINDYQAKTSSKPVRVTSSATWSKEYPTIDSIKSDADLVVKGKVEDVLPAEKVQIDTTFTGALTRFNFRIQKNLLDKNNYKKDVVQVFQSGGTVDGVIYEPTEPVKFLEKNKEYILFLKYVDQAKSYAIVGSFPGQFKINGEDSENIGLTDKLKIKLKVKDLETEILNK